MKSTPGSAFRGEQDFAGRQRSWRGTSASPNTKSNSQHKTMPSQSQPFILFFLWWDEEYKQWTLRSWTSRLCTFEGSGEAGVSKWAQMVWPSQGFSTCGYRQPFRLALLPTNAPEPCVSLALGAPEPQPDYQRVAQQWGRGLLGRSSTESTRSVGPRGWSCHLVGRLPHR